MKSASEPFPPNPAEANRNASDRATGTPVRVVLVTGGAQRLGREISLSLARAGWSVAVHYRTSEANAQRTVLDCASLGVQSAAFCADLSVEAEANGLVGQVLSHFGALDAVVNSASTFEFDQVDGFTYSSMERHMRANVGAAVALARDLHQHIVKVRGNGDEREGCVVNLLDQKLWNMNPDFLSYTLSKAALESAGTLLSLALAPAVRVVGVAPGLTLTSHMLSEQQFNTLHKLGPLQRGSSAPDVASTVQFALENKSITGTTLMVDAGQHLQRFARDFSLM